MRINHVNIFLVPWLVFFYVAAPAQHYFGIDNDDAIKVYNSSKEAVPYPWAGGMNSCQFGEVDMNLDGVKDLFVFDRMGDRIMTYINGGEQGLIDYVFAPGYAALFPELYDWVVLRDYNNDGREDIFTYARDYPGIVVYKNTSVNSLAFELEVYPFLTSLQGGMQVNILTTDVDYPGIDDIDNDGDMDILTFWGLGSFVEYHQNQSMELYGIPDSLVYEEVTQCWGRFAESDESNELFLDTCMGGGQQDKNLEISGSRHTGSTFLLLDLDADNDKDLLLGDVDYPNLICLVNGGTPDTAFMVSQDPLFPNYDKPVNLFSMPLAAYIDVNNDGSRDLLISPFDPSLVTSVNKRSSWYYQNEGSNEQPHFSFKQQDFLQEDMIDLGSGAYPVFEDYNGDGLLDLFIGNFGYYIYSYYDAAMILHSVYWSGITLYENTGTSDDPQFTHVTSNYAGLQNLQLTALYPTFADLDGDGDRDMLIGRMDGTLVHLENTSSTGGVPEYAEPVFNYQSIDVGEFSAPQLWDLDKDGLIDLVIGERNGNLNYYRNTGSSQAAAFELVTDSLGKINVTDYNLSYSGYSTPCFFNTKTGQSELLVGSEQGKVFYFKNLGDDPEIPYEENDSLFVLIGDEGFDVAKGIRTGATLGELNGDDDLEMIVGNYSGGLNYFKGIDQPPVSGISIPGKQASLVLFPNPAYDHLQIISQYPVGDHVVEVFDVYGRRAMHVQRTQMNRPLEVAGLDPGVYFLRITHTGNGSVQERASFIKVTP